MNRIHLLWPVLLFGIIAAGFASCKSDAIEIDGPYLLGNVYAIVENTHFDGLNNHASLDAGQFSLSAEGRNDNMKPMSVQLLIPNFQGVGRYALDRKNNTASLTQEGIQYAADSGYVQVNEATSGKVSGTFAFRGVRNATTKQVSAGYFLVFLK